MAEMSLKSFSTFGRLTSVKHRNPAQARRGRLLSILLLGTELTTILGLLAFISLGLTSGWSQTTVAGAVSGAIMLVLGLGLYLLNRFVSPSIAAVIFLLSILLLMSFADVPQQIVSGRTTVIYVLPIIMASVVLTPAASFIFAGLVCLVLIAISTYFAIALSPISLLVLFLVALVGWLAARSLENALADLQTINQELDRRVADRTRDLAAALAREQAEASQTQAILESIADGVIVFDPVGQAVVANPAIQQLLERPLTEVMGRNITQLLSGNVAAADEAEITRRLRENDRPHPNVRVQWNEKTLSVSFAPMRAAPAEVAGTVTVFRDYTREAEVDRMKNAFVSMVSHELRTPLSAILGYVEILNEGVYGPLAPKQQNVVTRILSNTQRLLSLVGDLLDQAQIEAGKLSFHIADFSPPELVDGVLGIMAGTAQARGLSLTYRIAEDVPAKLRGDAQRLHQILVNLVGNALKFTKRGAVTIQIYCPDAAHWALEVADTGKGIPLESQALVFEPFKQADSSITREHGGVGLGLSIVKKLVDLMQGTITLVSVPGQGSTFTVTLPLALTQEMTTP